MFFTSSAAEQNETLRRGYYEILFNVTLLHMSKMNIWSVSRLSSHLHLNTKAQRESARPSFWSWQALSLIFTSCGLRLRLDLLKWPFSAVLPVLYPPPEEHDRALNRITSLRTKADASTLSIAGKPVKREGWTQPTCPSHNAKQCREKRNTERLKVKWKICVWRYFKPVKNRSYFTPKSNGNDWINNQTYYLFMSFNACINHFYSHKW